MCAIDYSIGGYNDSHTMAQSGNYGTLEAMHDLRCIVLYPKQLQQSRRSTQQILGQAASMDEVWDSAESRDGIMTVDMIMRDFLQVLGACLVLAWVGMALGAWLWIRRSL